VDAWWLNLKPAISAGRRERPATSHWFFSRSTLEDVLLASSWLEGDAASQLVTKLNTAGPGANPDVPENQCARTGDVPPVDVMLIAQDTQDRAIVEVSFAGCTNRGLRNGRDTSRVSPDLLQAIMESLQTGYGFSPL